MSRKRPATLRSAAAGIVEQGDVPRGDTAREALTLAADQFVIEKSEKVARATIMAGYPWFTDWGRDTMIALPGLCLTTGRHAVAREILSAFAGAVHNGLLPNRFSDSGEGAEYNTVDASLWFFHAVYAYAEASGDWEFATEEMLPVLANILDAHVQGTDYNIGVDPADGLLHAGEPGVQLTWMDAKVGDWVVTPRTGKPVEINALWHNALCVTADLADRAGQTATGRRLPRRGPRRSKPLSQPHSPNPAAGSLFDVIEPRWHSPMLRCAPTRSSPSACRFP